MYTIILADDEYELRQAMLQTIPWTETGFEVIGEASNGIEALELVERLEPDLLMTDIKMPFVSGIELARKAREIRPAMQIAFLSGYDDFAFAKEAIQYNIISYMLKPLSSEEIVEELSDIRKKMDERILRMKSMEHQMRLEERTSIMKFTFLVSLCLHEEQGITNPDEKEQEFEWMAQQAGLLSPNSENKKFLIFVARFYNETACNITMLNHQSFIEAIVSKYLNCICVYTSEKIITIVSGNQRNLTRYEEILTKEVIQSAKKILNLDCIIGVSRMFERLDQTRSAYADAVTACEYARSESDNICFILDMENRQRKSITVENIQSITVELERRLKTGGDVSGFLKTAVKREKWYNNSFFMLQIVMTIYGVLANLSLDQEDDEQLKAFWTSEKISITYTFEDIVRMADMASATIAKQRRQNSEIICEELLAIIETAYMDETLSLSSISERLNVSIGYLSTIVKKIKGQTFLNLLTEKRMQMAKEYLFMSSKKIMEIAKDCGYSDYHYFSYCFKKFYGVSPNKMREK